MCWLSDSEPQAFFAGSGIKEGPFHYSPIKIDDHTFPTSITNDSNESPMQIPFQHSLSRCKTLRKARRWRFACISFHSERGDCGEIYVKIITGVKLNAREEMETLQSLSECWSGMCLAGIFFLAMRRGQASSIGITICLQHLPNIKWDVILLCTYFLDNTCTRNRMWRAALRKGWERLRWTAYIWRGSRNGMNLDVLGKRLEHCMLQCRACCGVAPGICRYWNQTTYTICSARKNSLETSSAIYVPSRVVHAWSNMLA